MVNSANNTIIVGGGMSGLVCASHLAESGISVLLLEKADRLGGSMRLSNGLIWTFRDIKTARHYIPEGNEALQELIIDTLPQRLEWLDGMGCHLNASQEFEEYGRGRLCAPDTVIEALSKRIIDHGGTIRTRESLTKIIHEGGSVRAVKTSLENVEKTYECTNLVICTGGFQGNAELVTKYITPNASRLFLRANPYSTGDGLIACVEIGAATTSAMGGFYGHTLAAEPAEFNDGQFQEMSQKFGPIALAVNMKGERFVDELSGSGEEVLNYHVAMQPGAQAIYIVDSKRAEMAGSDFSAIARVIVERAKKAGGSVCEASDLQDLSSKLSAWGVPRRRLEKTIMDYNEERHQRLTANCNATGSRHGHLGPLAVPPFLAVKVQAGITYTTGGLLTDLDMRVVRRTASISTMRLVRTKADAEAFGVFPNLYACGSDVGGVSGISYMGGLSAALVTGVQAANGIIENGT